MVKAKLENFPKCRINGFTWALYGRNLQA